MCDTTDTNIFLWDIVVIKPYISEKNPSQGGIAVKIPRNHKKKRFSFNCPFLSVACN